MSWLANAPGWVKNLLAGKGELTPEDAMRLSFALASDSIAQGGGPFGALITDGSGRIISAGWNTVLPSCDSTAHAEVNCIRAAQQALSTVHLCSHSAGPFSLFSSASPCIQCFGAVYWSGLSRVYAGARKSDVEALGFDEGPVSDQLWKRASEKKGIVYVADFLREEALPPLQRYGSVKGALY